MLAIQSRAPLEPALRPLPRFARLAMAAALAAALAAAMSAPAAGAMELSAFVSSARPSQEWKAGYGAALGSTWFRLVNFEAEVARQPEETGAGAMTSFTASALLAPRVGALRPYGGLGVGLFRQALGAARDTGTLKALVLGVKFEVGLALVKFEYRRLDLSGAPLRPLESRLSAGLGLAF